MEFIFFLAIIVIGFVAFSTKSRLEVLENELRLLRRQIEYGFKPDIDAQGNLQKDLQDFDVPQTGTPKTDTLETGPQETDSQETALPKLAALKTRTEPSVDNGPDSFKPVLPEDVSKPSLKPKKKGRSFEEEIGARWAVWVGGLTLALGAIFLLRFAVEAGVFSPSMRVGLTGVMGMISLGAGEFLRRKDNAFFKDRLKIDNLEQSAYIPGVLTGVGIFALYGAIYAAYGLYDLIPAIAAFTGMALVSFAALGLSLIQGPKIAGLGLIGSLATPLLVSSDLSNYPMLFTYIVIVTAASIILSRIKNWGWLAIAALFVTLFWMWMTSFNASLDKAFWPWCVFVTVIFAGAIWVSGQHNENAPKLASLKNIEFDAQRFVSGPALMWFGLWALIFIQLDTLFDFSTSHYVATSIAAGALIAVGFWRKYLSHIILLGGGLASITAYGFAAQATYPAPLWVSITVILALLFMGVTALKSRQEKTAVPAAIWAGVSTAIPILMILSSDVIRFYPPVNTALLLAGVLIINIVAACVSRRSNSSGKGLTPFIGPTAIYCAGSAAAYTLAIGYGFDGWPVSLAMMIGIVMSAAAYKFLKEPILKIITVGFAGLTALHVLFVQLPLGTVVGPQIIFNSLWFYLAAPAVICAAAAYAAKPGENNIWTDILKALSLTFAALFAVFQVRHLMNAGDLLANRFAFDEMALQVLVGLCFTLGGLFLGKKFDGDHVNLLSSLSIGVSGLTLGLFVLGVCLSHNPIFNAGSLIKGGLVFNNLMLAFLLPAAALGAIGWFARGKRGELYLRLCGGLSLASFMLYITTMIRRGFSGKMISIFRDWPGDVELYAISAAWLILGVALLTLGMKVSRRDVRLASAIVIVLTVLKAFLVDMASLEGALRAMSFVILGVVLIVIGRVYQRLLFSTKQA